MLDKTMDTNIQEPPHSVLFAVVKGAALGVALNAALEAGMASYYAQRDKVPFMAVLRENRNSILVNTAVWAMINGVIQGVFAASHNAYDASHVAKLAQARSESSETIR
jgi:hypothetical protein